MKDIFGDRHYLGPVLQLQTDFVLAKARTVRYGHDSLRLFGPVIWNMIPVNMKNGDSLEKFKTKIKLCKPNDCPCRYARIM